MIRNVVFTIGVALMATCAFAEVGKSTPKGFSDDFDASVKAAEKSGKNLWVLFTGSDWCYWCKKLEKDVISNPEFAVEGAKKFELVFLDFPQDKSRVRKELQNRNRELAAKYGIRGYPSIVLIDAKGEKLIDAERPSADDDFAEYFDEQLEKTKLAPDIARLITPYEDEFNALMEKFGKECAEIMKDAKRDDVAAWNAKWAGVKKIAPDCRAKAKEIRKRFRAETIPEGLKEKQEELLEEMFGFIKELRLISEGKRDLSEKDAEEAKRIEK